MPLTMNEIKELIVSSIPDADVELQDLAGDNNHFSAEIASKEFNGKTRLEQHKMVYNSLSEELKEELHALSIKTMEEK